MILSALSVGDIRQYDFLPPAFSKSLSEKLYQGLGGWFIYPAKHVYTFETEKINSQGISPFRIVGIGIAIGIAIGIGIEKTSQASIPIAIPIETCNSAFPQLVIVRGYGNFVSGNHLN